MSRLVAIPKVEVSATFKITEAEMQALSALFCYGVDSLLRAYYENCGTAYMKPHEAGLRSIATVISEEFPSVIHKTSVARKVFS
jgi:hypothetical protein